MIDELSKAIEKVTAEFGDPYVRGESIGSDQISFHFGAGMAVPNLRRERLKDHDLAAYRLWGERDEYYEEMLAAIAASPAREQ